jgi:hypothetical protein
MDLAPLLPAAIVALILLVLGLASTFFLFRLVVPATLRFVSAVFALIVSVFFDLRYLVCLGIAFATLAIHVGEAWHFTASATTVYILSLSMLYALAFGAKMGGKDIFEHTSQWLARHLENDLAEAMLHVFDAVKYHFGVLAITGGFAGCVLAVAGASTESVIAALDVSNGFSAGFVIAFDAFTRVLTFGLLETQASKAMSDMPIAIKAAQRAYMAIIGFTILGLVFGGWRQAHDGGKRDRDPDNPASADA